MIVLSFFFLVLQISHADPPVMLLLLSIFFLDRISDIKMTPCAFSCSQDVKQIFLMPSLLHRDQNDCEQIALLKREKVNLILDMIKILTDLPLAVHFGSQFNGRPGVFNGKMSDLPLFISSLSHIHTLRLHACTHAHAQDMHVYIFLNALMSVDSDTLALNLCAAI